MRGGDLDLSQARGRQRSTRAILSSVGTKRASICRPSRRPTSQMLMRRRRRSKPRSLNHALATQQCDLLPGQAGIHQHGVGVVAQVRGAGAHRARRGRELGDDARHGML